MKQIIYLLLLSTLSLNAFSQKKAEMIFKTDFHDFGEIKQSSEASFKFEFKNTGRIPLIITEVQSNCGCTVTEWTNEPILPRQKSKIVVIYDTSEIGSFLKEIKISSNAKNSPIILQIYGTVND